MLKELAVGDRVKVVKMCNSDRHCLWVSVEDVRITSTSTSICLR